MANPPAAGVVYKFSSLLKRYTLACSDSVWVYKERLHGLADLHRNPRLVVDFLAGLAHGVTILRRIKIPMMQSLAGDELAEGK